MTKVFKGYTEDTEQRLIEWAQWAKSRLDGGLGYPTRSVEGRLKDEGGVLPRGDYKTETLMHVCAEEIEGLVTILSTTLPLLGIVIKLEYLDLSPVTVKAKRMNISDSQYSKYRDQAKCWIDGHLYGRRQILVEDTVWYKESGHYVC